MHGANPSEAKTIRNQKPADDRVALLTDGGTGLLDELGCLGRRVRGSVCKGFPAHVDYVPNPASTG